TASSRRAPPRARRGSPRPSSEGRGLRRASAPPRSPAARSCGTSPTSRRSSRSGRRCPASPRCRSARCRAARRPCRRRRASPGGRAACALAWQTAARKGSGPGRRRAELGRRGGRGEEGAMVRRRTSSFFPSAIAALVAAVAVSACSDASRAPELSVGLAKRDITPDAATAPPDGRVYLGGYGLGPERLSTGVLAPIHARAFVVSNGTDTVAFVENETQGAFGAYRSGPFGLTDAAAAIEAASGGAIPRTHVFANSDHSHAGHDTTGVWGGLPETYLAHWRDQIVGAVMDAYAARRPAELWFGSTDATDLITSQFHQPPNDVVDGELRVLLAVEPGGSAGRPFGALVNYSAHATVMGGGNTLVSADWPGPFAERLERDLGIETAVVMVADVGRTQPRDGDVPGNDDYEKLAGYADRVESRALAAASSATRRSGTDIAATWLFLREPYANPLFPLSFLGSIISRSDRPPWLDDEAIGTLVGAARVGDVFFAAIPGEG